VPGWSRHNQGFRVVVSLSNNASVIINNGESETTNFVVELKLFADNPALTNMQISELSDFSDVIWINYQTNYVWTFSHPYGIKTIYARFSDGGVGISGTASDTIYVIPESMGVITSLIVVSALRASFVPRTRNVIAIETV